MNLSEIGITVQNFINIFQNYINRSWLSHVALLVQLMRNNLSIRLKAAFLLTVFSLNIVIGFACSIGIDMGFNKHHHDNEMMTENSGHHHSIQANNSSHHHDEIDNQDSKTDNDNCCKDKVTKLTTADKSLPQSNSTVVNPVFFTAFISSFYQLRLLPLSTENKGHKIFVRSSPPTIPDIRIAIQSFLI